jgi:GntR family transcriptional regulator
LSKGSIENIRREIIIKDFTPKYIKISEDIKSKIKAGTLKYGEKIYSEKDIMKKYGVSSTTARKALDMLRRENIIESIQGKGSFILQTNILRSLKKVISFTENVERQSLEPSSKVVQLDVIESYTKYHQILNLKDREKILRVKRVRFANEIPVMIDSRYINLKYCPGLEKADLSSSLYEIYASYNIKIVHSKQIIRMSFLNDVDAKLLNLKKFDPVIHIEGRLYSEDFSSIEYEEDLFNGTVFSFYVESNIYK